MESLTWHTGPFVHHINPLLAEYFGVKLWYYGLTYSLGFLGVYLWFRKAQRRLGWSDREILDLSILVALGVLLGGRVFEIVFYEWSYYTLHPSHVFSYWRGGMATHGILLGGTLGIWLFSRLHEKRFLDIADEMAIPGAFIMGLGRIGNFIDGNIVGSVTDVWWAVKFPNADGFRHPVTLYDSLKNFLIIPVLLLVGRTFPPGRGMLLAHFIFWYGFGRLFVDIFREYPTEVFGIGTGQYFNFLMAIFGLAVMIWLARKHRRPEIVKATADQRKDTPFSDTGSRKPDFRCAASSLWFRRLAFTALLLFPLIIPTDWTVGNIIASKEPTQAHEPHGATMKSAQENEDVSYSPTRKESITDRSGSHFGLDGAIRDALASAYLNGFMSGYIESRRGKADQNRFQARQAVALAHHHRRLAEPWPPGPSHHPGYPPR